MTISPVTAVNRGIYVPIDRIGPLAQHPELEEQHLLAHRQSGSRKIPGLSEPELKPAPADLPQPAKAAFEAAAQFVYGWLQESRSTMQAADKLRSERDTPFRQRRTNVSDEEAVFAEALPGAIQATYWLDIHSVAKAQLNRGFALVPSAPSIIAPGTHAFTLSTASFSRELSLTIKSGDNNLTALRKLADCLNAAELGVEAAVQSDGLDKETDPAAVIRLYVQAAASGAAGSFRLADRPNCSAIGASGIAGTAVKAGDAEYCLNGGERQQTPDNLIELQGGLVRLHLKAPTRRPVRIDISISSAAVEGDVSALLAAVNSLNRSAQDAAQFANMELLETADYILKRPEAGALGIYPDGAGEWKLDAKILSKRLESGPETVELALCGPEGIAGQIYGSLERLHRLPAAELLDLRANGFHACTAYNASKQPYLQAAMSGIYMNGRT